MDTQFLYRPVGELLADFAEGKLLLPNFQRDYEWDVDEARSFMASVLLKYPVGSLLIADEAERRSKEMAVLCPASIPYDKFLRQLAINAQHDMVGIDATSSGAVWRVLHDGQPYDCAYLLDGQQRLTTLHLMLSDGFARVGDSQLGRKRRVRWFLNLTRLGLHELYFPATLSFSHDQMRDVLVPVPHRSTKDRGQAYFLDKDAEIADTELRSQLADWCLSPADAQDTLKTEGDVLYPLHMAFERTFDEPSGRASFTVGTSTRLFRELFQSRRSVVIAEHTRFSERLRNSEDDKERQEIEEEAAEHLQDWLERFRDFLKTGIAEFQMPVWPVKAGEFPRLSGIFSVINIAGKPLGTFDLLTARTSQPNDNIKRTFALSVRDFMSEWAGGHFNDLLPAKARGLLDDGEPDLWSVGGFLAYKKAGAPGAGEVDAGEEFPTKAENLYGQTLCLVAKLREALGDAYGSVGPFATEAAQELQTGTAVREALLETPHNGIAPHEWWQFSDDAILGLTPEAARSCAEQAAKQLLRAFFVLRWHFGFKTIDDLPYRQMALVLACVLTDEVWDRALRDRRCKPIRRLERWWWGSIFSGTYRSRQDAHVRTDIPLVLAYCHFDAEPWTNIARNDRPDHEADRFEKLFRHERALDENALSAERNTAIDKSIRAFVLSRTPMDLSPVAQDATILHAGRTDLEADHFFARDAYNFVSKQKLGDGFTKVLRNTEHPVNSPLNFAVMSADSNRKWGSRDPEKKLVAAQSFLSTLDEEAEQVEARRSQLAGQFVPFELCGTEAVLHMRDQPDEMLKRLLGGRFARLKTEITNLVQTEL